MGLVEREVELATLSELLEAARTGAGGLAMIEAPAGQGKTALLRAVRERAKELGLRVLTATGSPLERDFPFGVVRQLLEAEIRGSAPDRLEQLLTGAAGMARGVFDAEPDPVAANDVSHAQLNGLFWLTVNLSEQEPLLLVVDDAHWADAPSLRFLAVLARRLEDLPVAVTVGARPAESDADQDLLDALALAPPPVTGGVVGRRRHLAPPALALVRAASVLGDRAEVRQVAALAGLDGGIAEAHAAAATVGLLDPGRPRFVHPLVAEAVHSDMSIVERGELHRRAAELLANEGGDLDAIAAHLMATDPARDTDRLAGRTAPPERRCGRGRARAPRAGRRGAGGSEHLQSARCRGDR